VKKYQAKLSGPILDRIDLQVELDRLSLEERFAETEDDVSPRLRARVEAAREVQRQRFAGENIPHNAAIPGGHVVDYCRFSAEGLGDFKATIDRSDLTTRSMDRLAKVARTIADLGGAETVEAEHVREAAGYVVGGVLREGM
jgi:magnesium chelatase family protein